MPQINRVDQVIGAGVEIPQPEMLRLGAVMGMIEDLVLYAVNPARCPAFLIGMTRLTGPVDFGKAIDVGLHGGA
jgi:hypothetical protein